MAKKLIVSIVLFVMIFTAGQVFAQDWTATTTSNSPLAVTQTDNGVSVRIGRWVNIIVEHECDEETGVQSLDISINEDPDVVVLQNGVEVHNENHPQRQVNIHIELDPAEESEIEIQIDFLLGPERNESVTIEGTVTCEGPSCVVSTPVPPEYEHTPVEPDRDKYGICFVPETWVGLPVTMNGYENGEVKTGGEIILDFIDPNKGKDGKSLFDVDIITDVPTKDENGLPLSESPEPLTLVVNGTEKILAWTSFYFYDGISRQMVVDCYDAKLFEQQPEPAPAKPVYHYTEDACLFDKHLAIRKDLLDGTTTVVSFFFEDGELVNETLPIAYDGSFVHLSKDPDGCEAVMEVLREDQSTILIRFNRLGFVDEIPDSEGLHEPDWSSFNDEIVSHETNGQCVIGDRSDARQRPLGYVCYSPDFSPDGMQVGGTNENGQLFVASHSGARYGYQVSDRQGTEFAWLPNQEGFGYTNGQVLVQDGTTATQDGTEISFNPNGDGEEGLVITEGGIYYVTISSELATTIPILQSETATYSSLDW